jgi:hypothetical protein
MFQKAFRRFAMNKNNITPMPSPKRPKPMKKGETQAQTDLTKVVWHIPSPVDSVANKRLWNLIIQEAKSANIAFLEMIKASSPKDKSVLVVPDQYQTDFAHFLSRLCQQMSHPDAKTLRPLWQSWDQTAFDHLKLKDPDTYYKMDDLRDITPWNR